MGLGWCAAGRWVRCVSLSAACSFRGAAGRGAVGAAGIHVSAFVGWRGGVCVGGWAWVDVPESSTPPLLEGLPQAPEDILVVLGRRKLAGVACAIHLPAGWSRRFSANYMRGRRTRP